MSESLSVGEGVNTLSVTKSRATSAPTSCSPIHAMACRHKKHAKKHWHEDSYIRDTSKCSPKGGREEGCGCMCSKFLSSSWGDLTCVWRKHDHSKTCSEYTTSVELSMRWLLDRRRLPRQCFNSFTVCCQFSSPPHQWSRGYIWAEGDLSQRFAARWDKKRSYICTVVAEECESTITSADCIEEEAGCPCKRTALQMYRPQGTTPGLFQMVCCYCGRLQCFPTR